MNTTEAIIANKPIFFFGTKEELNKIIEANGEYLLELDLRDQGDMFKKAADRVMEYHGIDPTNEANRTKEVSASIDKSKQCTVITNLVHVAHTGMFEEILKDEIPTKAYNSLPEDMKESLRKVAIEEARKFILAALIGLLPNTDHGSTQLPVSDGKNVPLIILVEPANENHEAVTTMLEGLRKLGVEFVECYGGMSEQGEFKFEGNLSWLNKTTH